MNDKPTVPTYKPNGLLLSVPVKRIEPKSAFLLALEAKQKKLPSTVTPLHHSSK